MRIRTVVILMTLLAGGLWPARAQAPAPAVPGPATGPATAPAPGPPAPAVASPQPVAAFKAEPPIDIPKRPDEPRAAKAYTLLETYCARCHQVGKTDKPLTSGPLANILDVEALAGNALYVKPGLPDASRLYEVFITRHAPLGIYTNPAVGAVAPAPPATALGAPPASEPEPEDIEALRTWIKDLAPGQPSCAGRAPLASGDVNRLALEAIHGEHGDTRDLRFISLANLYNGCATPEGMAGYRQAVVKLLNSLSWANEPASVTPLGPEAAVLAVRLSDLGWVSGHWDILQRIYPRGLQVEGSDELRTATGTDIPVLRGDWLADAASKPPLYYALLGVPGKLSDLAKINAIDIDQDVKSARARRIVVRNSAITRGNRLVERHAGGRGAFWLVYDFATSTGDQDLFERPLGPKASGAVKNPFKPDVIRALFTLPNGFLGYGLFDAAGNRIDRVLPGLEKPLAGGDEGTGAATKAGADCLACHTHGIKPVKDDFRPSAQTERPAISKEAREMALALFATDSENATFSDGDAERYAGALKATGVDPALLIDGQEPVAALIERYLSAADAPVAAAGQGLELAAFQKVLEEAPAPAAALAHRLQHGVLTRAELDRLLDLLKGPEEVQGTGRVKAAAREAPAEPIKIDPGAVGLHLWIDKARPAPGDLVVVNAEADNDCFLTIVSVDAAGKATVLFPNDFEPDNLVSAGKPVRVPGAEAPYQLRLKESGQETLLAQCSTSPIPPAGIEHDFERQRFTILGNWENFVHDMLVTDADMRRNPEKAERARAARAGALQRRQERGERTERRLDTAPGRTLRDGRAVIVIGNG